MKPEMKRLAKEMEGKTKLQTTLRDYEQWELQIGSWVPMNIQISNSIGEINNIYQMNP